MPHGMLLPLLALRLAGGPPPAAAPAPPIVIAVHGGAGSMRPETLPPEEQAAVEADLRAALAAGHGILKAGGSSLDAVEAAVRILEDSPRFNAGRGAVFTAEGHNELDAAVMEGQGLRAGAVAGVRRVRSPIALARRVMEHSPHVMLVGEGAERFAQAQGLEMVSPGFFFTEARWQNLLDLLRKEQRPFPARPEGAPPAPAGAPDGPPRADGREAPLREDGHAYGTVGAVALDRAGHLAAATSTGGMVNKKFGRVGDAPIIGAGTYADDHSCAVSATGHGEFFIRTVAAHAIAGHMALQGLSLEAAAKAVVHGALTALGGTGGVIAVDRQGHVAMPFNTKAMFRGWVDRDGTVTVRLFGP